MDDFGAAGRGRHRRRRAVAPLAAAVVVTEGIHVVVVVVHFLHCAQNTNERSASVAGLHIDGQMKEVGGKESVRTRKKKEKKNAHVRRRNLRIRRRCGPSRATPATSGGATTPDWAPSEGAATATPTAIPAVAVVVAVVVVVAAVAPAAAAPACC